MADAGDSWVSASCKNYFAIATRIEGPLITTIPLLLHTNFIVAAHCFVPYPCTQKPYCCTLVFDILAQHHLGSWK